VQQRTAHRTCPLCEATCGLEITLKGEQVRSIRGDAADVFSHGFLCPKGYGLKALHEDPDRLRTPMRRTPAGDFEPVGWDEAFALIDERLPAIVARGGADAVGAYLGNPSAHSLSALLYGRVLLRTIGTRNVFSASTVDQMPKQVACALMFGSGLSVPVPDVDRTDYLLILGANPLVSNGSLLTAPDMRGRLRRIRERGGRVVVIDPRRTRTAEAADRHLFIRPGTDALLLFAVAQVMWADGLADPGALEEHCAGLEEVRALAEPFTPERVQDACGVPAAEIRRLATELAQAPSAAVYGRIGTCTQEFGTVASWLIDVLNVLSGNLDRPGGAMFTQPAAGSAPRRPARLGRWASRVRGLGEVLGELPVACLSEEIETPGDGQIRALITVAGNPVLSTPNGARLARALEGLELMISVDLYLNETTRHADVILPAPSPLERSHYDLALYSFAARNVANYSPPVLPLAAGMLPEWQTLLRLTAIAAGQGPKADLEALDALVAGELVRRETASEASTLAGRDPAELLDELSGRPVRRPLRRAPRRAHPGRPGGGAARDRPRGAAAPVARAAEHGQREAGAGPGGDRGRRLAAARPA